MSRFRRRLMGLSALRQAMKDDFVRVEYIENTSDAYIDTLINLKSYNYKFELDCQQTELKSQYAYLMGQELGYENYRIGFYTNLNLVYAAVYGNQYRASTVKADEERHKYIYDKNILYVDGVETVRPNTSSHFYNKGNHLLLLRYFQTSQSCKAKIYSCKIYVENELVRDFIPMYKKSTKQYGLWDRVTEEFYVSPNGTKFIGGAQVIADADDNLYYLKNYIKCNGTTNTFINLSKFTNLDNVEFEVYSNTAHDNFIGSRSGTPTRNHFQISKWTNTRMDISFGQQNPTSLTSKNTDNKKFKIKLWERIIYLDNEKFYTCPNRTFTTNTVVSLGAVKGLAQNTSARFYWFKWWNKDKDLIYDMIPVQRISDGVWGMFCKVHLGFYPSNGSAQFTGG